MHDGCRNSKTLPKDLGLVNREDHSRLNPYQQRASDVYETFISVLFATTVQRALMAAQARRVPGSC